MKQGLSSSKVENNLHANDPVSQAAVLKVSYIQNEFMRSSFLSKCKPKVTRISALPTRIVAEKTAYTHQKKCHDPCLFGRAEIHVIFGLHFGRNDDLKNQF